MNDFSTQVRSATLPENDPLKIFRATAASIETFAV
jgi:hypothetical protein